VSERAIQPGLAWTARIPLLNNRFMLWDFGKVIVISAASLWLLVLAVSLFNDPSDPVLLPWQVPVVCAGILAVLLVIACLLMGNGYTARFLIDGAGVHWDSGPNVNRAVTVVGTLAGSPRTAGAGLLAASEETGAIPWSKIGRVNIHPGQRVISVRNSWRVVVRLYVPVESWESAVARVQAGVAASRK
jgi:hypothetical protein